MGQKVSEERAAATRLAIAEIRRAWKEEHGKEPTQGEMGKWFGVTQGKMSAYERDGVVGQKLADGVAEHLKTTVDGLIQRFLKEWRDVRVGDIPGWQDAVEQAQEQLGELDEQYFRAAANVVLPMAPRVATAAFAHDLASVLHRHVRASGPMKRPSTRASRG